MSAVKKKRKTPEKVPPPIKIKKEKLEDERVLHPLAHYIDDRLEMVKQIFSTLKPKTITNLAPDFLKNESIQHIEELCLAEVVCISKKRMLSIINATACPSDTETSSDTDVQHQEEHVSLEEISSCSEIEEGATNGVRKRKGHRTKVNGIGGTANGIKAEPNGKGTEPPSKGTGQISVLELLELQARARAIRSQLALEPITKIELHSDDENATQRSEDRPATSNASRKPKLDVAGGSGSGSASEMAAVNGSSKSNGVEAAGTAKKQITLKRYSKPADEPQAHEEPPPPMAAPQPVAADAGEPTAERSPTPDLIPIVAVPETVELLDTSDDDAPAKDKGQPAAVVVPEGAAQSLPDDEIEEGEISASDGEMEQPKAPQPSSGPVDVLAVPHEAPNETAAVASASVADASPVVVRQAESEESAGTADDQGAASNEAIAATEAKPVEAADGGDDIEEDNDDVISLEGGDLECEMIEHLADDDDDDDNDVRLHSQKKPVDLAVVDNDIISLESSDTEELDSEEPIAVDKHCAESWKLRYMKSDKMSKVLAQARLSKRVRDKIKESKQRTPHPTDVQSEIDANSQDTQFSSKHEDGSMQQYKELLEFKQQKQ